MFNFLQVSKTELHIRKNGTLGQNGAITHCPCYCRTVDRSYCSHNNNNNNNNRLSVTNGYDCILEMLLGSSKNGRLEVTQSSVSTISGTVSVIRRDAKSNTSGLTAPGSLNTCPMS